MFMLRRIGITAAIAFFCATTTAGAQIPPPDVPLFDPPDTEYSTGGQETDPATERGLAIADHHRAFLPAAVDLSSHMPAVGNQGKLGACAAWSTAYAARGYYTGLIERRNILQLANVASPSYVFHLAREGKCDDGTNIPRIVEVLKRGALSLADYPYSEACVAPAAPQFSAQATDFRVRGMTRVDIGKIDDIKGQLARSNPVIIRMQASSAFMKFRGAGTFSEPALPAGEKDPGWHFVTLVGYDEARQAFRFINSWGKGWGDQGYAWLSYSLLKTRITHAYTLDVGSTPPPVATQLPPRPTPPPPAPPVVVPPPVVTQVVPQPPPVVKPQAPIAKPATPPPAARPGVALVIGNADYASGRLATTIADASVVADTMRAAGYRVSEYNNVRKADIGNVLRGFLDQVAAAGPEAVAFFYFAGYAAQSGGQNFIIPIDATVKGAKDVAPQALRLDDLVAELGKLPTAARVLVLDAARDHAYGRGTPDLVLPGLADVTAPAGTMIAFPASPGRVATDDAGQHSLYTATLVPLMRTGGLDLDNVFKTARVHVNQASEGRQTPWTAENQMVDITLFPGSPPPQSPPQQVAQPSAPPPTAAPVPVTPVPATPVARLQLADLDKLSCGRVSVQARGGRSVLAGYVASDEDFNLVKSIAANVPNTSVGDVIVAPWPQCEALQTLEKPLGVADRPTIDIGPRTELRSGEPLNIQIRSPSQISYLYVAYIQADGSVVELVQPNGRVPQPTLPRQSLSFGGGQGGKPKFTIGPPFGREMIIAIASRSPLFDHELPDQITEREYLSELRKALVYKPVPDMPDRELAATMKTLQTRER
jgi:hypothetical protein